MEKIKPPVKELSNGTRLAYAELMKIQYFNFGGMSRNISMSVGEKSFRILLKNTEAVKLFQGVFDEGNDEAKMYALCGLRMLDRPRFQEMVESLRESDQPVNLISGCSEQSFPVKEVVRKIEDGFYDHYFMSVKGVAGEKSGK